MERTFEFPRSRRIYIQGSRDDLRVPVREVELTASSDAGSERADPPLRLYDTRGFHSDPAMKIDVREGLPELRSHWIRERGDVEEIEGRGARPEDDGRRSTATARWPGVEDAGWNLGTDTVWLRDLVDPGVTATVLDSISVAEEGEESAG